jgi:hypothetical protein
MTYAAEKGADITAVNAISVTDENNPHSRPPNGLYSPKAGISMFAREAPETGSPDISPGRAREDLIKLRSHN